ncbi:hypothetical protein F2P81_011448 [Scophthalmus maximus]|uniref:Uncharacterized protein n=1 Tax=Scophthalmus maximus TaxID=52904 RepID=A0A6A4SLQ2_SCOMX|nr:hypothetical protein F2P81_011448 [Scophthalmus maximus]
MMNHGWSPQESPQSEETETHQRTAQCFFRSQRLCRCELPTGLSERQEAKRQQGERSQGDQEQRKGRKQRQGAAFNCEPDDDTRPSHPTEEERDR